VITLAIGIFIGGCLGVIVMGLLAGNAYSKGGDDALDALARRRKGRIVVDEDGLHEWRGA
jgi:hypothetical protein